MSKKIETPTTERFDKSHSVFTKYINGNLKGYEIKPISNLLDNPKIKYQTWMYHTPKGGHPVVRITHDKIPYKKRYEIYNNIRTELGFTWENIDQKIVQYNHSPFLDFRYSGGYWGEKYGWGRLTERPDCLWIIGLKDYEMEVE